MLERFVAMRDDGLVLGARDIIEQFGVKVLALPMKLLATPAKSRDDFISRIELLFEVFLIGARPSKLRLLRSLGDLGRRRGMKHMLDYLVEHPESGLLGYQMGLPTIVQYWRSFEHLEAFAKNNDDPHLEVWRNYMKRVGKSDRTGIWHETYLARAGEYEAVYSNMPTLGLAAASNAVTVADSVRARDRLKAAPRK